MLHDDWLNIPGAVILHSFSLNLEWLVTKIPEEIFSQLYFYKGKKVKAHVISQNFLL
jgi:hypothetical protein